MKTVAQAFAKLLLVVGGVVFFFGDRALEEFWKVSFVPSLVVGIGGGIAFMVAGAAIQSKLKRVERKEGDNRPA